MAGYIFTDADMEANVVDWGEWLEEMLEAVEGGHLEHPLCPPVWSNGAQVSFADLDDEDRAALITAAEHFGFDLDGHLGAFEASVQATALMAEDHEV